MLMTGMELERSAHGNAPQQEAASAALARVLRAYAERGMLKDLTEADEAASFALPGAGRVQFVCDPAKRTLTLRGMLPGVPARGVLAADLSALIAACRDERTPLHRRIASDQATVAMRRGGGGATLVMTLHGADWEWAVRRMMNLAHEVRVMVHVGHPYYAQAQWGASQE